MLSLSDNNQAGVIEAFISTPRLERSRCGVVDELLGLGRRFDSRLHQSVG